MDSPIKRTTDDVGFVILITLPAGESVGSFRATVASLQRQVYPHWEAWLVPESGATTTRTLQGCLRASTRVSLVDPTTAAGLRSSVAQSTPAARWFTRVRAGDTLHPLALLRVEQASRQQPDLHLIYGDEDGIDASGRRHSPYFKPDADVDLLLAQDYVSKGAFVEESRLGAAGGFAALAASPHLAMLDLVASLQPRQVRHLGSFVYHRRSRMADCPYPDIGAVRGDAAAVAGFLLRTNPGDVVEATADSYRIRRHLSSPPPMVSVIIPVRDHAQLLRRCVDGLLEGTDYPDFELLVVDNDSADPECLELLESLRARTRIRVLRHPGPFNFSAINNRAATQANGGLLLLLNNDIEILGREWMTEMASQACRTDVGAVGAMLYYPDGTIQHAGVVIGLHGVAGHPYSSKPSGYPGQAGRLHCVQALSAVTAACLMVRKSLYIELGGLDEGLPVAFNDVDFCLRLGERGFRTIWTPYAELCHHESFSRGQDDDPAKRERLRREIDRFSRRWAHVLGHDPAYHPSLPLDGEAFCPSLSRIPDNTQTLGPASPGVPRIATQDIPGE